MTPEFVPPFSRAALTHTFPAHHVSQPIELDVPPWISQNLYDEKDGRDNHVID